MSEKIKQTHLARLAIIYLRQSTLSQVQHNPESTKLQYSLLQYAEKLGWSKERIESLDNDLGKSGKHSHNRSDFQKMMNLIANNEVGIIIVSEISRLSRDMEALSRLVKFCGITNTLIADYQSIYDPNNLSDRFALGIRGTLSEVELFTNQLRLQETKRNKAKRGESELKLPTGLIWKNGKIEFDLEEGVQSTIQLLFDLFERYSSGCRVLKYCQKNQILVPTRRWKNKKSISYIEWKPLSIRRLYSILHNPSYAGAYCFGRSRQEHSLPEQKVKKICLPMDEWEVIILDYHAGFISWERFLINQDILAENCTHQSASKPPAPREGAALLQGIVICGVCGYPMRVHYDGNRYIRYNCDEDYRNYGAEPCWTTSGNVIDEAVGKYVLQMLSVEQLDLSLAVLDEIKQGRQKQEEQWKLSLKQAEDAVKYAKHRYELVDPGNRRVAAHLEQELDNKLMALDNLHREFERNWKGYDLDLSDAQQQQILNLVQDYPTVWNALTTTPQQRKEIFRLLVKQVSLSPVAGDKDGRQVKILWGSLQI